MPHVSVPDQFNAATYVVDRNLDEGRGDHIALLCGEEEITYVQLAERVNRTGNAFSALGLEMEQRVLLLLLDCPAFAYCFFGAIKIGAVPVPVNTLLKPSEYRYLLRDSRARVLVVSRELLPSVEPILGDCPYLRHVLVVGEAGERSFEERIAAESPQLSAAPTTKDDVAFWLYTSGTTGLSRAAVHLQHDMVFCSELYFQGVLHLTEADRTFSVAKLFFAYGLGNALYGPLAAGATTILFPGRPLPEAIFGQISRYHPTLFFAVPTAYAAMLQTAEGDTQADLSSVRHCVSAGEPLPAGIYRRWLDRFGVEILDGIGSTEILHIFLSNQPGAVRPGSSGTPVPGYEIKLVDDDGRPVASGEIGNLAVSGDSTCAFYWNRHDMTRRTIQGEWIRTGDKYHVDEDGYYWYDGRSDDMLKVGGIWVSPTEVEGILIDHPAVLECAVVGLADRDGLVKPKAYVVLKDHAGDDTLAQDLQEFVKSRTAPYKYPRWIEFIPELPKTATGKIQRFKLRQSPG
jgi:benzoate-CoA ligase family protein